jgi:hypothetical protein
MHPVNNHELLRLELLAWRVTALFLLLFATFVAYAEPATLLSAEHVGAIKVSPVSGAQVPDHHLRIEMRLPDGRIMTLRSMSMGGGALWLMNHPEALTLGHDYELPEPKRGQLKLPVGDREFTMAVIGTRLPATLTDTHTRH